MAECWADIAFGAKEFSAGRATRTRARGRKNRSRIADCPQEFKSICLHANTTEKVNVSPAVMPSGDCDPLLACSFQTTLGSPMVLLNNVEQSNDVIDQLESADQAEKHKILMWLLKAIRQLALSKSGCRIVQKAFEVAGGSDRDMIIAELKDHIVELYESPHGNHVLSRAIEVLPAAKTAFIISALRGRCTAVSTHRFGCRVVCRLIEHCVEEQIGDLLDEVVLEADTLARHAYGNFIVQSTLEHMTVARRSAVLSRILPGFASMATHRTGSLVAQRALDYCDAQGQALAIQALYQQGSVVEIACSHYGSYVIEQVASLSSKHSSVHDMAYIIASNLEELHASEHAQRVLIAFGLAPATPLPTAEDTA
jgi:hypothetical protein